MSDADATFRNSLIGNLEELCDIIPDLNVANDPKINELAAKAKAELTRWDAQEIRDDTKIREDVSKAADKLAKNMVGMV